MRCALVGLFLLGIFGSPAFGQQATGYVEKIGFGKHFRPYGWTPMMVSLTSQSAEAAEYRIEVRQEDLDRDKVIFTRDITLNARSETTARSEQFWVYFLAQPRGLPEGQASVADLNNALEVRLCTRDGKPLMKLPIQDAITTLDPPRDSFVAPRGKRLVLIVTDGINSNSTPALNEFGGGLI
jgi:hypothetical protein